MSNTLNAIKSRRTIYAIGNQVDMSAEQLDALIRDTVKHVPSAFNSQSTRTVQLFGAAHQQFWQIAIDELKKIVPADAFTATEQKLQSFAAGYATVLFYEDQSVVKGLQEQFAAYADNFPIWSEHASAMAQFALWTVLAEHNIGASLQHYNPIVDAEAAKAFDIPSDWKLRAQLVIGSIEAPAGEKSFIRDEQRFKSFFDKT
ncbi:nitroreductase family protein [Acinetobacter sp. c2-A9]|uniref:nitroreductase family protein n=1 Tax=Acinetobacter sp. c2-A9 TaxID=3342802 RepID=UPI0035BAE3F5